MSQDEQSFLVVTRGLRIPLHEIELRASRSSGPGGQHANKTASRVEAVFNVEASHALGPGQRARLLARLGPVVRAVAQDERSQLRNRERALARLADRLADALRVERRRVATHPTDQSRERRLAAKRRRGELKTQRHRPSGDDA